MCVDPVEAKQLSVGDKMPLHNILTRAKKNNLFLICVTISSQFDRKIIGLKSQEVSAEKKTFQNNHQKETAMGNKTAENYEKFR